MIGDIHFTIETRFRYQLTIMSVITDVVTLTETELSREFNDDGSRLDS